MSELDSSQNTMATKKSLVRGKHRARATSSLLEIAQRVEGPVTNDSYEIIENLLGVICNDPKFAGVHGGILIFLPGMWQIQKLHTRLTHHPTFGDEEHFRIFCLHSQLNGVGGKVFDSVPEGVRKIVISTNIAETGVTIPDIVFVIDSCRVKQQGFDERRQMKRLEECFVSQASAMQRQGRAGRVREGFCFRLITDESFGNFARQPLQKLEGTARRPLP